MTSQTDKAKRLQEAYSAIANLERTLNVGDNRFGAYGRIVRDGIKRWEATIAELKSTTNCG